MTQTYDHSHASITWRWPSLASFLVTLGLPYRWLLVVKDEPHDPECTETVAVGHQEAQKGPPIPWDKP